MPTLDLAAYDIAGLLDEMVDADGAVRPNYRSNWASPTIYCGCTGRGYLLTT